MASRLLDDAEDQATTLDHWQGPHRAAWEQHSELGCNLQAQRSDAAAEPWIANINPPGYAWDARWLDIDVAALRRKVDAYILQDVETDMPHLRKEQLADDFQRLFVEIVLRHVRVVLAALDDVDSEVQPLRLILLGTAGTGKTHAVQTLLQELKAVLQQYGYARDILPRRRAYRLCCIQHSFRCFHASSLV